MEVAPDSSGLYNDLMTRAAEKIGFKLNIVRRPKKRLYRMLREGRADLYASALFREKRSEFLFYIPNGLHYHKQHYGLTSAGIPPIKELGEIKRHNLFWVVELGSSKPERARKYDVNFTEVKKITVENAVQMLKMGRPFFFLLSTTAVKEYMRDNHLDSMSEVGVRLHICTPEISSPLFSNFSRNSKYCQEEVNPDYCSDKPLSPDNFPFQPIRGSVPHKLRDALQEMIDDGEVDDLARKYFGADWRRVIHFDSKTPLVQQ
ncbi:substrate-binding periplasmic protein [Maridesulfovibrio sp.]|uniref:substrate-binding periplasmic protein n=1 Tax=Maridesulfovibrio sp. TaxID=2795000 RepID=UPI003BAA0A23